MLDDAQRAFYLACSPRRLREAYRNWFHLHRWAGEYLGEVEELHLANCLQAINTIALQRGIDLAGAEYIELPLEAPFFMDKEES